MLNRISIAAPCSADWDSMPGSDRVRHCGQCNKNVYNLSAMTRRQAEALLREKEGQLCARLYRRADGTILTSNCPAGLRTIGRGISRMAGAAMSAMMTLSSAAAQIPFFQIPAAAQEKDAVSAINGIVQDPSGAVVARAAVTLIRAGERFTAHTDEKGKFSIKSLVPGFYSIRIESAGFALFTKEFVLGRNRNFSFTATLNLGSMGEVVEVVEAVPVTGGTARSR